jgi:DNA-binding IclR family transcriptional regulator
MPSREPSSRAIREHNLQLVLDALGDGRTLSRAELAARTQLSKPTVAGALRTFEDAGLVREFGARAVTTGAVAVALDAARQTVLRRLVDTQPAASV